jgi:hypothetical protein
VAAGGGGEDEAGDVGGCEEGVGDGVRGGACGWGGDDVAVAADAGGEAGCAGGGVGVGVVRGTAVGGDFVGGGGCDVAWEG